jgi:hypothetical protein
MIKLGMAPYGALWGSIWLVLGIGWTVYGITGGNRIFLIVMVALSMGSVLGLRTFVQLDRSPQ